jgi:hypothetical protein
MTDYTLSSEHDFDHHFYGQPHHAHAVGGAAVDDRRHPAALQQPAPNSFAFTPTNHPPVTRFGTDRGVASDTSRYVLSRSLVRQ